MCGFSGYTTNYNSSSVKEGAESIRHRGPDAHAYYQDEHFTLSHHRLSIIDLSEHANQPYHFEHLVLLYNGEIYNYQDIRRQLTNEGYTFSTNSDTEVLIKAFHCWNLKALDKCIGMFAFAVYNTRERSMYLCRDRMGVKPLYYTLENGLAFGSELRTIIPVLDNRETDPDSVYEYFRLGYISADKTIFKAVKKLEPGHYLCYRGGEATTGAYWKPADAFRSSIPEGNAREWEERLHHLMKDAFSLRMVADVPVGVFLSGGIDSSLVTAILQKHHGNIHTFTIGFDDARYNEAHMARKVAEHLGTRHTEFTLDAGDANDMLGHFYDIYDEPFADSSGIPTAIVSRLAAKAGIKVVLSGEGGDELFCGYGRYPDTVRLFKKTDAVPHIVRAPFAKATRALYKSRVAQSIYRGNAEHKIAALSELLDSRDMGSFYNNHIANQAGVELNSMLQQRPSDNYTREIISEDMEGLMFYDMTTYLPDDLLIKMDRATMYSSIEGREPFLDHRIVELALQMPAEYKYRDGQSKWILRQVLGQYIPEEYYNRPKQGFSIPIFKWFARHMDELFTHYFDKSRLDKTGIFHSVEVLNEYSKYQWNKKHGKEYNIEKMWRILSFMMWWDKWHSKL